MNFFTAMSSDFVNHKCRVCLLFPACLACLAGSAGLLAQDAALIVIGKQRSYFQESASGAVIDEDPYRAFAFIEESSPGSILANPAPTLTAPGKNPEVFELEGDGWNIEGEFETQSDSDSEFPNGTYNISFTGATSGTVSGDLTIEGDTYPNAPSLSEASFNGLKSGNLATGFTLEWVPFQGGTADDLILVCIEEFGAQGDSFVFETEPFDLNGNVTSHPIPAGTLSDTGGYEICIEFLKVVNMAFIGGAEAFAFYSSSTCLEVGDTSRKQLSFSFWQDTGFLNEPANMQVTTKIFPLANRRGNLTYVFQGDAADFPDKSLVTFGAPSGSPFSGSPFDGAVAVHFFGPDQGEGFGSYSPETAATPTDGSGSGTYTASVSGVEVISKEVDFALLLERHLIVVPTVNLNGDGTIQSIDIAYRDAQNQDPSSLDFIQNIGISIFGMDFVLHYEEFTLPGSTNNFVPPPGIGWNDVQKLRFTYFSDLGSSHGTDYAKGITPLEEGHFEGTDIEGFPGWRNSPWYSDYNVDFWPWIFHAQHGWQYIFETEVVGEVFIYGLESLDYWWASSAFEPLTFYSFNRGTFNFYFGSTTGPRSFVDLQTGQFWSIP